MGSPATAAVIQYLATEGYATQGVISNALSIPQASVSRILRETTGIVKNDQVVPALYSFDASATIGNVNATTDGKFGNYTAVIRPDGRILLGGVPFDPVSDRLAHRTHTELLAQLLVNVDKLDKAGGFDKIGKDNVEIVASTFDALAISLRRRIAEGDFD